MNRYAACGLLQDAADGRRVIVVSGSGLERQAAFEDVVHEAGLAKDLVAQVRRANGSQRVEMRSGGWVATMLPSQLRGSTADVVFLDGPTAAASATDAARAVVASALGEVVRA